MDKNYFVFGILILLIFTLIVSGCGFVSVRELKEDPEKYIGKEIAVSGVVSNSIKIGTLSGFSLTEGDYTISVQSKELPAEGKKVTVQGVLMKEVFLGYYIYAKKIY